ncbi:MAG: M23 family metallopeptidase [Patescibacteria group bacterium]
MQIGKNLLSRKVYRGVALSFKLSKIGLRFYKLFGWPNNNFSKVAFILSLVVFLSGYYPTFSIPPVNHSRVSAQSNEQSQEIIASSFPQPVKLPHDGYLSNRFSWWHPAVDVATNLGTEVHPITSGSVVEVNVGRWGYGNHIVISHPNGFGSLYGHLGKILVQKGQGVTTDTVLGEVGMTGFSSGPHTHLEITHNGKYINPLFILPEISDKPEPKYITKQSLPPKQ